MVYGSYDYNETEVTKLTEYLQGQARKKRQIPYDDAFDDAFNVASRWGKHDGPHDKRLWDLLGLISEREVEEGRCALSAIVVTKAGERPGQGFFKLERKLGRYKADDDATWLAEIDGLFKYWPEH